MNNENQARPFRTARSMLVSGAAFMLVALLPSVAQAQTPPTLTKVFAPTSVQVNGTSTITFVASNTGATTLTGVTFTDTFPAGMIVATPNNINGFCTGGSSGLVNGNSGGNTTSLFGTTLLAGTLCQYSIDVVATTIGTMVNTTSTITSNEAAAGAAATATLAVGGPPTLTKLFAPASIPVNGTSTITFVASNPGATTLTGVVFTDTFPAGMIVATPNNINGFCTGGSSGLVNGNSGGNTTSLFNTTLVPGSLCQYSIDIVASVPGSLVNTTSTLTSNEATPGTAATATLAVIGPPLLVKSFGAPSVAQGVPTSLTFVVTNPNASAALTGVGFVDNLPAGLSVTNPNGLAGSCGGGTITAVGGSGSVTLSGATLAGGASCTFSVNVSGINIGTAVNTTGAVTSNEGGAGGTATASLAVGAAVTQVIPTLSQWMLGLLGLMLVLSAWFFRRRQNR